MEEGPEPQEWVERTAEEHHHGEEGGHGPAAPKPITHTKSAITAAVLAVLAAIGSLLSGHAANQAILGQSQASDQWAYYQSKSTKGHMYEVAADLTKALGTSPASQATATIEHFRAEANRYNKERDEIQRKAEHLEAESRHEFQKHQRFALGVAAFQVGIVLASVSILVSYRPLYLLSLAAGAGGLVCLLLGLMP